MFQYQLLFMLTGNSSYSCISSRFCFISVIIMRQDIFRTAGFTNPFNNAYAQKLLLVFYISHRLILSNFLQCVDFIKGKCYLFFSCYIFNKKDKVFIFNLLWNSQPERKVVTCWKIRQALTLLNSVFKNIIHTLT